MGRTDGCTTRSVWKRKGYDPTTFLRTSSETTDGSCDLGFSSSFARTHVWNHEKHSRGPLALRCNKAGARDSLEGHGRTGPYHVLGESETHRGTRATQCIGHLSRDPELSVKTHNNQTTDQHGSTSTAFTKNKQDSL